MSKTKSLKRERRATRVLAKPALTASAPEPVLPESPETPRCGFSLMITWDPKHPEQANYNVMNTGEGTPRDGDILSALQMTRDHVLMQSAIGLLQRAAQANAPTATNALPPVPQNEPATENQNPAS